VNVIEILTALEVRAMIGNHTTKNLKKFTKYLATAIAVISGIGIANEFVRAEAVASAGGATTFHCIASGQGYATIAKRGERITAPVITWNSNEFGTQYTPHERCKIVSDRLSEVVAAKGGKLRNLQLTYGRVNSKPVICYVGSRNEICNRKNILMTLRESDRGKERQILEQLVTFSLKGTGTAVQQSAPQYYAPFGEEIERALSAE
jgi:hypothetical protein